MVAPSQRESKTRRGLALVYELVCENEPMNGTDPGRMNKRRRQHVIETLRSIVRQSEDGVQV